MSRSVARGAILGIGGQVWHLAMAFLLYAFLARRLGPAGFGEWKLTLSLLNWFELFVNAGLVKVATKAIAECPDDRPRVVRGAYLGQMVLAVVLFLVALVAAGPIANSLNDPDLAFLLRVAVLDIPLYAAFMVAAAVLLGVQRFERHALGMTVYATAKLFAIGALVWFGFSVPGALIGNALASIVGFAVVFGPWPKPSPGWSATVREARSMGPAAIPFLAQNLLEGLASSVDLWSLKRSVGSSAVVGYYGAAATLAEVPMFMFVGLNRALFPSMARVQAEGDTELEARYARQGVRMALIVTVFGAAVIAGTGRAALTLVYSSSFVAAFAPLVILMFAACGRTVWSVCTEVLMVRDRRRTALGILASSVVVEIGLLAVLSGLYGSVGAATAVAIAAFLAALATVFAIRELLDLSVLLTLVRATIASAVVGVVLWLMPLGPISLFVAYPVSGVAYVGLLRLLREVDDDDVESIRDAIGKRRRS